MSEDFIEHGMFFSDRCRVCRDFGEKEQPYLCHDCIEQIKRIVAEYPEVFLQTV